MYIHQDVVDLLFQQEHLNYRLEFLYDAMLGEPTSNHYLIYHQPFNIFPTWHQYSFGGDNANTPSA